MFDFLAQSFSSLFSSLSRQRFLTAESVKGLLLSVREALLQADVPLEVVEAFLREVESDLIGISLKNKSSLRSDELVMKKVHDRLVAFLGGGAQAVDAFFVARSTPAIIMVMGLQGSGKTTTVAKLGSHLKDEAVKNKRRGSVLVGSVDFYRPAALDQLEIVALQAGISFYRASAQDPIAAAQEIVAEGRRQESDFIILDTAGRLHVDQNMLDELCAIDTLVRPTHKLLVLDAMTGQESLRVARSFDGKVGFAASILTKMDSDTRGGAAFAFRYALNKPILFVGVGERISDLERFYPERIATRMLGMGDIVSLVEKANEKIRASEQQQVFKAMSKGQFTLEDFAQQMDMMGRLGSLGSLVKYLPGAAALKLSAEQIAEGERELKKCRAIMGSMTKKERLNPSLLDGSRKKRIARGAGVDLCEINAMLQRFEESRQLFKQLSRMGGGHFGLR